MIETGILRKIFSTGGIEKKAKGRVVHKKNRT